MGKFIGQSAITIKKKYKKLSACFQGGPVQQWILHVDMDAFFASIEQLDAPELRGKPVVVGGGVRGVVSAASYEARVFGVHSAMPTWQAQRLCPQAIVVPGRMRRYVEISRLVMQALQQFSPTVEQASVDEAYLDATGLERLFGPVESMAQSIKEAVTAATGGLTCSIGLAPLKFLAKIASDLNKPNGVSILYPQDVPEFLRQLPVQKIPGVGKTFMKQLENLGIRTGGDVIAYPQEFWERRFGKGGIMVYERAKGIDRRQVHLGVAAKSESAETTLTEDTQDKEVLRQWLFHHADRVGRSVRRHGFKGRVVHLKIKFADFRQITRQTRLPEPTCATRTIYDTACQLLEAVPLENKVRLIGLGLSAFDNSGGQGQLFLPLDSSPHAHEEKRTRLDSTMDALRERFGQKAITHGALFFPDSTDRKP